MHVEKNDRIVAKYLSKVWWKLKKTVCNFWYFTPELLSPCLIREGLGGIRIRKYNWSIESNLINSHLFILASPNLKPRKRLSVFQFLKNWDQILEKIWKTFLRFWQRENYPVGNLNIVVDTKIKRWRPKNNIHRWVSCLSVLKTF